MEKGVQPCKALALCSFEDAPLEPRRATLETNWVVNFENTELIRRKAMLILQGQKIMGVGPPLTSVVVGAMAMPLVVRGGLAVVGHCCATSVSCAKNVRKAIYLGCPVCMFRQLDRKPFYGPAATSSNHTF